MPWLARLCGPVFSCLGGLRAAWGAGANATKQDFRGLAAAAGRTAARGRERRMGSWREAHGE